MTPYYEDGLVTIYHGDCREWMPEADLLLTDPPYGIGFAAQPTDYQRLRGQKREQWDDHPVDYALLETACARTRIQIIWGGNYYPLPLTRAWMVWVKPDGPPSFGKAEMAWTSLDRPARYISWTIAATNAERVGHPTQKPLAVMSWCLGSVDASSVLDPFMGSGTSLVAAKVHGIPAIGIEIEERYCEIAANRCRQEVLGLAG